jgi:hypothetical protein
MLTTQIRVDSSVAKLGNAQSATLTLAGLDPIYLPFIPNGITWNYLLNKQSFDTFGGRVTQILSVKTDSVLLQGEAGTRARLLDLFEKLQTLQAEQIKNQQSAKLHIPLSFVESTGQYTDGKAIDMNVWFRTMNVSIDSVIVTYPYQINFEVEDHEYGKLTNKVTSLIINGFTEQGTANFSTKAMGLTGSVSMYDIMNATS